MTDLAKVASLLAQAQAELAGTVVPTIGTAPPPLPTPERYAHLVYQYDQYGLLVPFHDIEGQRVDPVVGEDCATAVTVRSGAVLSVARPDLEMQMGYCQRVVLQACKGDMARAKMMTAQISSLALMLTSINEKVGAHSPAQWPIAADAWCNPPVYMSDAEKAANAEAVRQWDEWAINFQRNRQEPGPVDVPIE